MVNAGLVVVALLAACSLPQPVDVAALHHQRCIEKGYQPGSDGLRTCMLLLELYADEEWERRLDEIEERREWRERHL